MNMIFIGFFFFKCVFSFAFVLGVIDVVWQPQSVSSAKRINLKFTMNELQRKESHEGRDGKSLHMCVCVCLTMKRFVYMYSSV